MKEILNGIRIELAVPLYMILIIVCFANMTLGIVTKNLSASMGWLIAIMAWALVIVQGLLWEIDKRQAKRLIE